MTSVKLGFATSAAETTVKTDVLGNIGCLIRAHVGSTRPKVVVVSDSNVRPLYGPTVIDSVRLAGFPVYEYTIPAGEASKSWATAVSLFQFLADQAVGRDGIILALGGGVVSDLAGFAAATWTRGVRFAICPTTLEADIDAAIGGKTAIDIPGGKNLVGAFHHPFLVAIDAACLATLPRRDLCAGMAESIKHALISSGDFLSWHEANVAGILALDPAVTLRLIENNIAIKSDIVMRDAMEQTGLRARLNLGHTIGHAIEECCGFTLRHGECVALGLVAACRLSHRLGLLDQSSVERVERLLSRFNLPTRLENPIDADRILSVIHNDKKVRSGSPRFVLLEQVGRPVLRGEIEESAIRSAFVSLLPE